MFVFARSIVITSALALGGAAALSPAALAGDGGAAPGGPVATSSSGVSLAASNAALAHHRLTFHGAAPASSRGRRIVVQRRAARGWDTVARTTVTRRGAYAASYTPAAHGRYTYRAVLGRTRGAPQVAVTIYKAERATWYGPGLWGNPTACGGTLTHSRLGVAHRTLPCGTKVRLMYRGRSIVVPVIDRGPFGPGVNWDLTQATAERLGMTGTSTIGVLRAH